MSGMDISKIYYLCVGRPMLLSRFPELLPRIAAGLAGEGSECFGYDDAFSEDHDFAPSFCLWLTREDYAHFGSQLQQAYDEHMRVFIMEKGTPETLAGKRRGVLCIEDFYRRYTGSEAGELSMEQWRAVPQSWLATATNGEVFEDGLGHFTAIREKLLSYYPEDIRRKKLSVSAAIMGQAGQYNLYRCLQRKDLVAAQYAVNEFSVRSTEMVFLLNRRYMPFYKWMHRSLMELPLLGNQVGDLLAKLAAAVPSDAETMVRIVEEVCQLLSGELRAEGLSNAEGTFMLDHAFAVKETIRHPDLRKTHVMEE